MSFDPIHLWNQMTPIAQGVVVLLLIMSIYSLTVAFSGSCTTARHATSPSSTQSWSRTT